MSATEFVENAEQLLREFGENVTFSRAALGSYDPATRTVTTGAPESWTSRAWVHEFQDSEVDGSAVLRGDRKLLVLPDERLALTGVTVEVRSETLLIVEPIRYGPQASYVLLQVRK